MAKGLVIDLIVEAKDAIKGISQAQSHAERATGVLKGLGRVGAVAVTALGTAAVAAGGALSAASVSAAAYADDILTTATNTNISTDALQAYKYAAEQIDVSFETFTKSQGKFTKSMQDTARTGTGPAAEAFKALGLSVKNSDGSLKDSTELYWAAIDALGQVENETLRTALAQQLFGKSGAELNSLIAQGSEGFKALTEEARAMGAILSGEQLEKLGAFDDKIQQLTATAASAKNALGLTLLPVLDDLAGSGASALGQFTASLVEADGDMSKAAPAFETLGTNVANALTSAVPKILQVGTSLVTGLLNGIVSQGPALIQAAVPLIVNFATGLLTMLPKVLDAGLKILIALVQGIASALPQLIPAAVKAVLGLVRALIANLPMLLQAGLQLIMGLAEGIVAALPGLIAQLPWLIRGIIDFIVSAIPQIIETGIQLFLSLVDALPDIITGIVNAIPTIITGIIGAVLGAIPQIITAGVQLLVSLIKSLPTIITTIVKAIPQIITGIVKAIANPKTLGQLAKAGGELIKGLWNGISDLAGWLWSKVSGFLGGVVDNIKSFFGIASPSKLFASFGRFMVQGLENGLTGPNHIPAVMRKLSSQVVDGFGGALTTTAKATVAVNAESSGVSSGQVVINVNGGLDSGVEIGRRVAEVLAKYKAAGGRVAY